MPPANSGIFSQFSKTGAATTAGEASVSSFPFFFNLYDDLRPTPFGQLSPDKIDWEHYGLAIEVGKPVSVGMGEISIHMSSGENKELLQLLDRRPMVEILNMIELKPDDGRLTKDMTAKQCFEVIKKYYEYQ